MSTDPGAEVLDHGGASPSGGFSMVSHTRRRWVLPAVGASVLMLGVAGAGIALGMMMSGGGTQPEELVPADALLYLDVDFDPAAGQKANLVRLLSRFPEVASELGGREDIRQLFIEKLTGDTGVDSAEVLGWLGDRAGFAVVPGDTDGTVAAVAVLQVTDEAAARVTLEKELAPAQVAYESGYVVVATDSLDPLNASLGGGLKPMSAQDVVTEALATPLADDQNFQRIFEPLGDGLASVYVDADALTDTVRGLEDAVGLPGAFGGTGSMTSLGKGQAGAILRADPDAIEVLGRSSEPLMGAEVDPAQLFAGLPQDTAMAIDVVGAGQKVQEQWERLLTQLDQLSSVGTGFGTADVAFSGPAGVDQRSQFERSVARFEKRFNVKLPDDIATVLGDEFVVALSGSGLVNQAPAAGVRTLTDPVAARELTERLQSMINELTGGFGFTLLPVDDGLVVASTSEYAGRLAAGDGGVLDNPKVKRALPDLAGSVAVVWVDFDVVGDIAGFVDPSAPADLAPLEGLGVTVNNDDGGQTVRARLTFDE